jgi:hypothetical protein
MIDSGSCGFQSEHFNSVCRLTPQGLSSRSSPLTMTGARRAAGCQGRQRAVEIQGRLRCLTAHCTRSWRRGSQLLRRRLRQQFPHTSPSAAGRLRDLPEDKRLRKQKCVWTAGSTSGRSKHGISAGTTYVQAVKQMLLQMLLQVRIVEHFLWCRICWRQATWKSRCA